MLHSSRCAAFLMAAAIVAILTASSADAAAKKKKRGFSPGAARWEIKTSIPASTDLRSARHTDLQTLLAIEPPAGAKGHSRKMDNARYPPASNAHGLVEGEIISVTGWIHLIAAEPDGDYHIQIAQTRNDQTRCFIVEVPRPLKKFVKDDRARLAAVTVHDAIRSRALGGKELRYGATVLLKSPIYAIVTGQFFYDDWHIGDKARGKKGCKSPTVAEIHPITAIEFPASPQ